MITSHDDVIRLARVMAEELEKAGWKDRYLDTALFRKVAEETNDVIDEILINQLYDILANVCDRIPLVSENWHIDYCSEEE